MLLALLMLVPLAGFAQYPEIQHDKQKEKQWRSMENGPWDFSPDWYYYLFHKNYSGASLSWKKRIMPVRVIEEETQRQKVKKVNEEYEKIEELHKEEVERAADRNVDLIYTSFKDDFNRMQDRITEGLLFCMTKSGGKMKYQVNELSRENEIVCQNIEYIHKQGVGYELENAKRQQAYSDAKTKMEGIVSRVAHLVGMAQCYY